MTSWDPLAGAPEHVSEEVRMLLSGDDEMNNPQCALEVSLGPSQHSSRTRTRVLTGMLDGDLDAG